jgi:hypothetical protein
LSPAEKTLVLVNNLGGTLLVDTHYRRQCQASGCKESPLYNIY